MLLLYNLNCSLLEGDCLATTEEQAIAAINAAEQMAIANIQLIRQLKGLIPAPFSQLTELAIQTNTAGVQTVAAAERGAVRKVSKASRQSRKNLSAALKEANKRLRTKSGALRKGKTQADVMKMAHKMVKKNGTKKGMVRKTARRAFEGRRR